MPIRRCTCDSKVDVHEECIPDVHGPDPASCWRPCVCGAVVGAGVTNGRLRPWTGATPLFGMPHTARRTVGMCTAIPPPPGVAPGPAIPCGKAIEPAFRGWLRPVRRGDRLRAGRGGLGTRRARPSGRASRCPRRSPWVGDERAPGSSSASLLIAMVRSPGRECTPPRQSRAGFECETETLAST